MSTKAEALQSVITWIPVSERLPDENGLCVLVSRGTRRVLCFAWLIDGEWQDVNHADEITHWAELPLPPTERPPRS